MNINQSRVNLNQGLLNLNTVNNIKDEVIETSEETVKLTTNELEPQEQLLIPNSQQILMNNGVKINYLSITDSIEIAKSVIEKDKGVEVFSQPEESAEPIADKVPAPPELTGSGIGWRIFRLILKTASFIINPIGTVINGIIDWVSDALRK